MPTSVASSWRRFLSAADFTFLDILCIDTVACTYTDTSRNHYARYSIRYVCARKYDVGLHMHAIYVSCGSNRANQAYSEAASEANPI